MDARGRSLFPLQSGSDPPQAEPHCLSLVDACGGIRLLGTYGAMRMSEYRGVNVCMGDDKRVAPGSGCLLEGCDV